MGLRLEVALGLEVEFAEIVGLLHPVVEIARVHKVLDRGGVSWGRRLKDEGLREKVLGMGMD